ncbi:MAG: ROK family protein [Fretibacterium sp.]|nr:ROK family protein [Fretibacterium sp.]
MAFYIGIDIGGTNIKAGIVDELGNLLGTAQRPTGVGRPLTEIFRDISRTVDEALATSGLNRSDTSAAGAGCPGAVLPDRGLVVYNNNLGWHDVPLGPELSALLGLPVVVGNDANVAALGEAVAGCAKGASSAIIITLGTGVGCGVVLNGSIWTGWSSTASEFGHMVIVRDGRPCTCGRKGCLESYASATGLIALTREAMAAHPDSLMHRAEDVDGRTAFDAARAGDIVAQGVVDDYIDYLACGLANLINGLQPEVIGLGGGVAEQGEALFTPLREKVRRELYGGGGERSTRILPCTLGYQAGLIGAAMAAMQHLNKGDF